MAAHGLTRGKGKGGQIGQRAHVNEDPYTSDTNTEPEMETEAEEQKQSRTRVQGRNEEGERKNKKREILVSQDPKLSWWYVLYVVVVAVREHEREKEYRSDGQEEE